MTRGTADLLLLLAALIWGLAFVGQSTAMSHVGPLTFIGARFLLATLSVLPFALRESAAGPEIPKKRRGALVGVGIVFFLGAYFQQAALQVTSVTNAGFLTALYVVFVPAIGALVLGHKLPGVVWPAAALSLLGTFLLGGGRMDGLNWGDGLVIVGAVFWAMQILGLGSLAYDLRRPFATALSQFAVAAFLGFFFGFLFESPSLAGLLAAWREVAYTGFISGGFAFTLQSIAQSHTPPSDCAIILSLESLFAALFGALILGERLEFLGWIGGGFVLLAAIIVQVGPLVAARRLARGGS
jgi:drug/metabolite transporter (DMT)-like permease